MKLFNRFDNSLLVLALEHGNAGFHPRWLSLWSGRTILVRRGLQSYDCLFRGVGYLVQKEDSGSPYSAGNCQDPLW